jgi:hypothetical protein
MAKKMKLSVVLLLLSFTAIGCGGGGSSDTYTISGNISSSGKGLQGVIVSLNEISLATSTTDATGNYAIKNIGIGTYTITPNRTGYTFSPSTLTAVVNDSNVSGQDFIVTANTSLTCTAGNGSGTNGIQFYNYDGMFILNSSATANMADTLTLAWQVEYQNIFDLPADAYSGSLRARLWAVPYSVSSGVFDNAYVIGEFYPNFTGSGAASQGQLYVGSTSDIQITSSTGQNPPAGEYCIVAVLEEYNGDSAYCSSPDHYCVNDWWQSGNAWKFY